MDFFENGEFVDLYEFLMISENADLPMLEAAVRLMLAKYKPGNPDTGNQEKFELVKKAYLTLSDSHQRALYDKRRREQHRNLRAARDVSELISLEDVELEKRRRQGVMLVLYKCIMERPHAPGVAVPQIADALEVSVDDLHFAFWFLRELGWIKRGSNGNFEITVQGVEWVENGELPRLSPQSGSSNSSSPRADHSEAPNSEHEAETAEKKTDAVNAA